ncbi:MAG: hypothetical protein CMP49_03085 [Flavobacteriales bacterium]|nr:hypothetical protein [Flavobacteriales bacterium]|tara:strand:- start:817 stop:1125 length:309 start_codon:yes stop_codon:yes gene_type:complete
MKKLFFCIGFYLLIPASIFANDCEYIMDNNRLEIIINQIHNQSEDMRKLNIIKTYLQRLCINTNQMVAIMETFESKEFKNEFFIYSKEYIIDIENYNQLNKQ